MQKRNFIKTAMLLLAAMLIAGCSSQEKETAKTDSIAPELPSLQAQLDEKAAGFEKRASEEVKKAFNDGVDSVAKSGVMESALKVGDTAPDFTLPNASGEKIQLATILQNGPVILTWYRGGW